MTFAKKIKQLRETYGLNQTQFAEMICVNRKHYCGWENEQALPKLITLIDMASILEISVSKILEGVDEYN